MPEKGPLCLVGDAIQTTWNALKKAWEMCKVKK